MANISVTIRWQSIHVEQNPIRVEDRAQLLTKADACVPVGTAPDGLPLVMRVSRSASIIEPVLRAVHAHDVRQLSGDARKLLVALNQQLQLERRQLGIVTQGHFSQRPAYVSMNTVPSLLGETLLCRFLDNASPLLLPEDRSMFSRNDAVAERTSAGVLMSAQDRVRIQRDLATVQHMVLPLDDAPASVVRQEKDGALSMRDQRPLVFEDLRVMRSARFHHYRRGEGMHELRQFDGELGDNAGYRRALRDADAVGWSVTRDDLLRVIADVALSLEDLHADGFVHGDIKPANVLIGPGGAVAHDSLDVKMGSISAAGTKGWNAPEQIIARPVSAATDVFALAQLVVQVLEAAVFGDERSFVVPVGGGQRIRERLLVEPDVYLDPNLIAFDDAAIAAWRGFLRRCLALESDKRIQSMRAFADELLSITRDHPVPGRRTVGGLAGRLTRHVRGEGFIDRARAVMAGDDEPFVWMLNDSYSHVHRAPWRVSLEEAA